jgi:Flp pilus assembly protein TadG
MGKRLLSRLWTAVDGSVVIETAVVAPVLLTLSLGGYDAGRLIARQSELQSAAAEAEAIVQAATPSTSDDRDKIRDVLKATLDPNNTNPNDTESVTELYRCGTTGSYVSTNTCAATEETSKFIQITLTDTYTPLWTSFGVGHAVNFNVVRMVQVS